MNEILLKILSIVLFLIALGVLVAIHEFGHFIAAKSFNVYCSDFSIGFGPKFIKHKRKNGETTFSMGIIPFGGYVSMYGEGSELPEDVKIDRSRSMEGISRWKRIIIFLAGVTMNFVLAFLVFVISSSCFPQVNSDFSVNVVEVTNSETFNSTFIKDDSSSITLDDRFVINAATFKYSYTYETIEGETKTVTVSDLSAIITTKDSSSSDLFCISYGSNWGYSKLEYSNMLTLYNAKERSDSCFSNIQVYVNGNYVNIDEVESLKNLSFTLPIVSSNNTLTELDTSNLSNLSSSVYFKNINDSNLVKYKSNFTFSNGTMNDTGISAYARFEYLGLKAFSTAGKKWVDSTTQISGALFNLIKGDKSTWEGVGGPVAIFSQTTQILSNFPFNYYLDTWGIISVNLALFNLLPFPGLDGWQVLVEIIEAIGNCIYKAKRKVSKKDNEKDAKDDNKNNENNENNENSTELVIGEKTETDVALKDDSEWHIPQKLKTIVSGIGLVILFAFMIFVLFKDIFIR